ncbi:hypothetical protein CDCA_CDCA17G4408 [Cyanidium caldarium]|uniref:Eukaryotic translation initiation factor 4 gamma 2 n=1 Tax=Cyanidium caldarium TaxID=2771 RepID=A0AAV9J2V6_CYACA|nr:hypothetical protein CDCA_CDCA17G4408 [Cyanidium caldarium]
MSSANDENEWEQAAEEFVALVASSASASVSASPTSSGSAVSGSGTGGRSGSDGRPTTTTTTTTGDGDASGRKSGAGGAATAVGAEIKASATATATGGSKQAGSMSATAGGGIQVVRFGGNTSLTATVRPLPSAPDRARSAYGTGIRHPAHAAEVDGLAATLSAAGVGNGQASGIGLFRRGGSAQRPALPPLKRGANAWRPSFVEDAARTDTDQEVQALEQARRKAKAVLNKLVPERFETLTQQILDLPLHKYVVLEAVISEIFDKALAEPYFCGVYADLCEAMNGALPEIVCASVDDGEADGVTSFRRMLLAKCRREFVNRVAMVDSSSSEQVEETYARYRRRTLGNIIFIGELFKRHLLSEKIIHECVQMLLKEGEDEDSIETLAKLLSVAGAQMDRAEARPYMNAYFVKIQTMSDNPAVRARYRFMLKDCIDLRKNQWKPRRAQEAPSTLDEIHGKKQPRGGRGGKAAAAHAPRRMPKFRFTGGDAAAVEAAAAAAAMAAASNGPATTGDSSGTSTPERPLPSAEEAASILRGVIEDYVANPSPEEARRSLETTHLTGQPERYGPVAAREWLRLVLTARERDRVAMLDARHGALSSLVDSATLMQAFADTARELLELEDEWDMPVAAAVLGECAAQVILKGKTDSAQQEAFLSQLLSATPPERRAKLLQALLETWLRGAEAEAVAAACVDLQLVMEEMSAVDAEALGAYLGKRQLEALLPPAVIENALRDALLRPSSSDEVPDIDSCTAWLSRVLTAKQRREQARGSSVPTAAPELPALCRALATTVFLGYVAGETVRDLAEMTRRLRLTMPLLQVISGGVAAADERRQVQIVFAAQAACHRLDFPPDLMNGIFQALYDADVVSEEAFDRWREDVTDITPGKTKALFQVNAFLTWLREADEEEDEQED